MISVTRCGLPVSSRHGTNGRIAIDESLWSSLPYKCTAVRNFWQSFGAHIQSTSIRSVTFRPIFTRTICRGYVLHSVRTIYSDHRSNYRNSVPKYSCVQLGFILKFKTVWNLKKKNAQSSDLVPISEKYRPTWTTDNRRNDLPLAMTGYGYNNWFHQACGGTFHPSATRAKHAKPLLFGDYCVSEIVTRWGDDWGWFLILKMPPVIDRIVLPFQWTILMGPSDGRRISFETLGCYFTSSRVCYTLRGRWRKSKRKRPNRTLLPPRATDVRFEPSPRHDHPEWTPKPNPKPKRKNGRSVGGGGNTVV